MISKPRRAGSHRSQLDSNLIGRWEPALSHTICLGVRRACRQTPNVNSRRPETPQDSPPENSSAKPACKNVKLPGLVMRWEERGRECLETMKKRRSSSSGQNLCIVIHLQEIKSE